MPKIKTRLYTVINASRKRGTQLENILLSGPPGTGKTLLAHVIAREMGMKVAVTTGADLGNDAWKVEEMIVNGSILFIDEIHQLPRKSQDVLLPWLEQGRIEKATVIKDDRRGWVNIMLAATLFEGKLAGLDEVNAKKKEAPKGLLGGMRGGVN